MQRGVLLPGAFDERVELRRLPPPADLEGIVDRFWSVTWDLEGEPVREQETLPFPCVNVVIGAHRPGVHGPATAHFVATLEGRGWVLGTKLRPAGARGLLREGLVPRDLVDRAIPPAEAFAASAAAAALERAVLASADLAERATLVSAFVRTHHAGLDDDDRAVNHVVEIARTDPGISRVTDLAERVGRSPRTLERLLRTRLGVSPKMVIRRFRVQEAAARLASGEALDCAALAQLLGYFDQSHFIRDFKSQVGRTPLRYRARQKN